MPPKPSGLHPDAPHPTRIGHVAHRRNAARRYVMKLLTTYPSLPLEDRKALAHLLIHGPDGDTDR